MFLMKGVALTIVAASILSSTASNAMFARTLRHCGTTKIGNFGIPLPKPEEEIKNLLRLNPGNKVLLLHSCLLASKNAPNLAKEIINSKMIDGQEAPSDIDALEKAAASKAISDFLIAKLAPLEQAFFNKQYSEAQKLLNEGARISDVETLVWLAYDPKAIEPLGEYQIKSLLCAFNEEFGYMLSQSDDASMQVLKE